MLIVIFKIANPDPYLLAYLMAHILVEGHDVPAPRQGMVHAEGEEHARLCDERQHGILLHQEVAREAEVGLLV